MISWEAQAHFGRELQLQRGVFGLFHAISLDDELDWLLRGTLEAPFRASRKSRGFDGLGFFFPAASLTRSHCRENPGLGVRRFRV